MDERSAAGEMTGGIPIPPDGVDGLGDAPDPATREGFLPLVAAHARVLEIGPFANPAIAHARYLDVLDADGLRARAVAHGQDPAGVPEIDYVSPTGDLAIVPDRFDAVFTSHVIEHQPDLIRHLEGVADLLEPGGRYYLMVPDMRYCFDALLAPTRIAQVLTAHYEERRVHTLESVLEHIAFTSHNDATRHWRGDSWDAGRLAQTRERAEGALAVYRASEGGYIDVHAWKFTPQGFEGLLRRLGRLGYIRLVPEIVHETPWPRLEFAAILRKPAD